MRLSPAPLALILLASACSSRNAELFLIEPPPVQVHVANRLGRIEVRDVALPQYASAPEIALQFPDGSVRPMKNSLWADTPGPAITRTLADQLSAVSGATAIAAPWPLSVPADRTLEVRIDQILAGADGRFHLKGQYFVSSPAGRGDLIRRFDIAVRMDEPTPREIAKALASALQRLALRIARLQ